jgi:hypothetical protein
MERVEYLKLLKKLRFFITILLVAFVFTACASSSDDDDDDDVTSLNGTDTSIPSTVTCNAAANAIQGTWITGCYSSNDGYHSNSILISGDCMVHLLADHQSDDTTCAATPKQYFKKVYNGLEIGDITVDSNDYPAIQIDGIWVQKIVTPMIDANAAQVNDACGTRLNSGESVNILGLDCAQGFNNVKQSVGDAWQSLHNVTDTVLRIAHDGEYDSTGREDPISQSNDYTRQ